MKLPHHPDPESNREVFAARCSARERERHAGSQYSFGIFVDGTFAGEINLNNVVRGAMQSFPTGQWESAYSLAFTRRQTLWLIILPQGVKRMLPPWMNVYCILAVGTVLASVVGVQDVMTLTGDALSAENRPELLMPFYAFVLLLFFIYCYPIARWTVAMERKWAVKI